MLKNFRHKLGLKLIALGLAMATWAYVNWPIIENNLSKLIQKNESTSVPKAQADFPPTNKE